MDLHKTHRQDTIDCGHCGQRFRSHDAWVSCTEALCPFCGHTAMVDYQTLRYQGVMTVSNAVADEMERLCASAISQKKDGVEFDQEYVFPDDMFMAIQVCPAQGDTCWTQGVLYTPDGSEVGCTDTGESFLGDYHVEYKGGEYIVTVVRETRASKATRKPKTSA